MPGPFLKTFEVDVQAMKVAILEYAKQTDMDSARVVAAMAEVVGLVIAVLESRGMEKAGFEDYMGSFADRARQSYRRNLANINRFVLLNPRTAEEMQQQRPWGIKLDRFE